MNLVPRLVLSLALPGLTLGCAGPAPQQVASAPRPAPHRFVRSDGTYPTVPLEKSTIVLKVVQSSARPVRDPAGATEVIAENLAHVLELGRRACSEGDKPDILLFHEFPLTGFVFGDRESKLKIALEIPGPETEALGALARQFDTYVIFGSYARDPEWPGHILSLTTVIGRDGRVLRRVWKPRNIKRFYPTFEITTTTVESVQERFRARYGASEELPVIHTEFGNLAVSTVQLDPLVFNAFALQGAELILRTSTLFFPEDVIYTAMVNRVFSAMANIPADSKYGGNSMIVSPEGEVLARLERNTEEGVISARIPIAKFRAGRGLPQLAVELTRPYFGDYAEEIPPDHLDLPPETLPADGEAMKALLDQRSRWRGSTLPVSSPRPPAEAGRR